MHTEGEVTIGPHDHTTPHVFLSVGRQEFMMPCLTIGIGRSFLSYNFNELCFFDLWFGITDCSSLVHNSSHTPVSTLATRFPSQMMNLRSFCGAAFLVLPDRAHTLHEESIIQRHSMIDSWFANSHDSTTSCQTDARDENHCRPRGQKSGKMMMFPDSLYFWQLKLVKKFVDWRGGVIARNCG